MTAHLEAVRATAREVCTPDWAALDWRFLLPDPSLGRTACIHVPPGVRDALFHAGTDVTTLDGGPAEADWGSFDAVVCCQAGRPPLADAVRLLRANGTAIVHLPGWPVRASSMRQRCRQLGARMLGMYLHYPNFARSRYILPLHDHAATRFALSTLAGPRVRALKGLAPLALALAPMLGKGQVTVVVQPAS